MGEGHDTLNSTLVGYAPYDDPKTFAVVVPHLGVKLEVGGKWNKKMLFELFQELMHIPAIWVTGGSHETLYEQNIEKIKASREVT